MDPDAARRKRAPRRRLDRVILHFDLDCFYAQCIENRQPSLKALPLGIKQKGILATCNYVARRHGVKKLMPIAEAKRICPDLVLADGEDLSLFRDVSKRLYALLRSYSWNGRVERLGLDEIFLDVTDIVSYNVELLNRNALRQSYFCLSRLDPEVGFEYDATSFAGCVQGIDRDKSVDNVLHMRLLLASHLARYLRLKIEEKGYTTACGISTNKVLAKLVGDRNKPRNQTTLLALTEDDVISFMDEHSLRKVPGIGSRTTRVLEGFILDKEPDTDTHSMECSTTVGQVRTHPDISPPALERLLSSPGAEKGLGAKVWSLLHGIDDAEVKPARDFPTQISIEDTYRGLNEPEEIHRELLAITASLLRRMHVDLVEDDPVAPFPTTNPHPGTHPVPGKKKWLAHPKTLRLSTRPYHAPSDTGSPSWARQSRSTPLPAFVFNPNLSQSKVAERLVNETLMPLFYKLHPPTPSPDKNAMARTTGEGWNIGLLNVCVTNMTGVDGGVRGGRDIGEMLRRQEGVLREFTVYDHENHGHSVGKVEGEMKEEDVQLHGSGSAQHPVADEDTIMGGDEKDEEEGDGDGDSDTWDHDETPEDDLGRCPLCDRLIPRFAMSAHERYHSLEDP